MAVAWVPPRITCRGLSASSQAEIVTRRSPIAAVTTPINPFIPSISAAISRPSARFSSHSAAERTINWVTLNAPGVTVRPELTATLVPNANGPTLAG